MKLSAHTTADPTNPIDTTASLLVKHRDEWQQVSQVPVDTLTAMAEFRLANWDASTNRPYRVVCGASELRGTIRAEPSGDGTLKVMAVACVNDKWFPYSDAVARMIKQNPDLILFDNPKRQITLELHTMDNERRPNEIAVPGWPLTIDIPN